MRSLFNAFVRGVGKQLAGYGFEPAGGGRVFRRISSAGDMVIVELQSSNASTESEKAFYINVALVLAPEWESAKRRYSLPATELPRTMHGMWRHRIGLTKLSGGDQWRIVDKASAADVSSRVKERLDEELPNLLRLLDRALLVAEAHQLLGAGAWRVRAWLLAEHGPSAELENMLFHEPEARSYSSVATNAIWDHAQSVTATDPSGRS